MFGFFKRRRRDRIRSVPFPSDWLRIVERNVPLFGRLSEDDQRELLGHVQVFLAEKNFEGCGGLELTDEIKLTIAAHACLLVLHRPTDYFPRLITILVYPSAYVASDHRSIGGGLVLEGEQIRLGEAWKGGVVVVSWKSVKASADGRDPGQNLVLHEFAHQLDMEDGAADGTPVLSRRGHYSTWTRVLGEEFDRLQRDHALGRYSVLDTYGATNPAEFFAVATEAFFEKARLLQKRHPELYQTLQLYYPQDPAAWPIPRPAVELDPRDEPGFATTADSVE